MLYGMDRNASHIQPGSGTKRSSLWSLSDLKYQSAGDFFGLRVEERRSDMEAPIGIWKERADLPNSEAYLRALREDDREVRFMPE
jgi:hypothetical protein